jgi:hypothetical protein
MRGAGLLRLSGRGCPDPPICAEEPTVIPFRMGSAGIFLDRVPQSHLAGRSGLIDREPLAVDGGGVRIGGGIPLGHGTHVNIEAEQYPRGVGGRGSLSEPRGKTNYDNSGREKSWLSFVSP